MWPGKESTHLLRSEAVPRVAKRSRTAMESEDVKPNDQYEAPEIKLEEDTLAFSEPPRHQIGGMIPLELNSRYRRKTEASPWQEDYIRMMYLNQCGEALISHNRAHPHQLVAIKQISKCTHEHFTNLPYVSHENLVSFSDTYFFEDSIYLVTDVMSVHLNDIINTPLDPLTFGHMAQICLSILKGLRHIHSRLHTAHGKINPSHVLLNRSGKVRVGELAPFLSSILA